MQCKGGLAGKNSLKWCCHYQPFFLFSFFSSLLYKYSWLHVKVNAHNMTFDSLVCILSRLLIFFFFFFSLVWKKRIHCCWGSTFYALAIFRKLFMVNKFCFYCALMVLEKISIMDHVCALFLFFFFKRWTSWLRIF